MLNELNKKIINCQKCSLAKTRTNAVPGEGPENAKIMFIGEALGEQEDIQGRPFVGPAGKFLTELLKSINLQRDNVFISNVVKCRPKIDNRNRPPKIDEINACKSYLDKQIEIIKPKVIVTLGNIALQTLLGKKFTITEIHSKPQKKNRTIIFPMHHPAVAVRFPKFKKVMQEDVKKLKEVLKKEKINFSR